MQKELASKLLGLLDSNSLSVESLEVIERCSEELARPFDQDSEERAVLASIALAVSTMVDRLRKNRDPQFHRFFLSQLEQALRTAVTSLDLVDVHKLITAIATMPKTLNA